MILGPFIRHINLPSALFKIQRNHQDCVYTPLLSECCRFGAACMLGYWVTRIASTDRTTQAFWIFLLLASPANPNHPISPSTLSTTNFNTFLSLTLTQANADLWSYVSCKTWIWTRWRTSARKTSRPRLDPAIIPNLMTPIHSLPTGTNYRYFTGPSTDLPLPLVYKYRNARVVFFFKAKNIILPHTTLLSIMSEPQNWFDLRSWVEWLNETGKETRWIGAEGFKLNDYPEENSSPIRVSWINSLLATKLTSETRLNQLLLANGWIDFVFARAKMKRSPADSCFLGRRSQGCADSKQNFSKASKLNQRNVNDGKRSPEKVIGTS